MSDNSNYNNSMRSPNDDSNSPPWPNDFVYPQTLPGLGNFAPMQHTTQQQTTESGTSMNDLKQQLQQLTGTSSLLPGMGSSQGLDPSTSAFLAQLFMDSSKQQQQQQQQQQNQVTTNSVTNAASNDNNANATTSTARLDTSALPFALTTTTTTAPITAANALATSLAPPTSSLVPTPDTNTTAPAATNSSVNQAMMMSMLGDPRLLLAQTQILQQQQSQQQQQPFPLVAPAPPPAPPQQQQAGEMPLPSPHSLFHRDGSRRMRGGVIEPFPEKLHRLLIEVEQAGRSDVISFVASGRAFAIHKPDKFFKEIVPLYFRQSRLSSFKRQLNLYGFELINAGPARGGYFHNLFQRDHPELCRRMRRVAIKVGGASNNNTGQTTSKGQAKAPLPDQKSSPDQDGNKSSTAAMEALLSNDVELPPGDAFSPLLPSGEQRRLEDLA